MKNIIIGLTFSIVATASVAGCKKESPATTPACSDAFDATTQPDKLKSCQECERLHRGMGTMEADCKSAIPKPWR